MENFDEGSVSMEELFASMPPARGRRPDGPIELTFIRDITTQDIAELCEPTTIGSKPPALQQLRARHHRLAHLLASGMKQQAAADLTGYSNSRISILLDDPAFQNLVSYYRTQMEATFADVHQKLAGLGEAAIEELRERLEAEPDKFEIGQLRAVAEMALDRSVAPPKTRMNTGGPTLPTIKVAFLGNPSAPAQLTIEQTDSSSTRELDALDFLPE